MRQSYASLLGRELISEKQVNEDALTVTSIKNLIKGAELEILVPDYFETSAYNDDEGVGGHEYIKVLYGQKPRPKDLKDIEKIKSIMKTKYGNSFSDIDNGFLIKK